MVYKQITAKIVHYASYNSKSPNPTATVISYKDVRESAQRVYEQVADQLVFPTNGRSIYEALAVALHGEKYCSDYKEYEMFYAQVAFTLNQYWQGHITLKELKEGYIEMNL